MTKNRNYKIVPYDTNWPALFLSESKKNSDIIGNNILETHHIGSTSVPGMSGKPTIDILFVVRDISRVNDNTVNMRKIGYSSLGALNDRNSHLLEKEENGNRTYIVHFYPQNHSEIEKIISIRDYLRSHKDEVKKYSELKLALVHKFPNDYEQYRSLKDEYMKDLKKRAIYWYRDGVN